MNRRLVIALAFVAATVGVVAVTTQLRGEPAPGEADGGLCPSSATFDNQTWTGVKTDVGDNYGPSHSFAANTVFCVKAANMNSGIIGIDPPWPGGTFTTGPSWSPPNADISNYVIYGTLSTTTTTTTTAETTTTVVETTTTAVEETTTTAVEETTTTVAEATTTTEGEGPGPAEVTTTVPVTTAPVTTAPVTTEPDGAVPAETPTETPTTEPGGAVPAETPTATTVPARLPTTGSGAWELLLVAIAAVGGGVGLRLLSRRD